MLAGGRFFVASNAPGFVTEAMGKGAGLIAAEEYPRNRPGAADVVVVSWCTTDAFPPDGAGSCTLATADMLADLASTQALLVGVGPASFAGNLRPIADTQPAGLLPPRLLSAFGGSAFPIISLANLLCLWAFTAELISACARTGGRMLAVYQSALVPGGRRRNDARLQRFSAGDAFEPGTDWHKIAPARGELTARYITETITILESLNWYKLDAAITVCAMATANGGRVVAYIIGHSPVHQWGTPADLSGILRLAKGRHGQMPDADEVAAEVADPRDVFVHLGYYSRPVDCYSAVRKSGGRVIEVIAAGPGDHCCHWLT